MIVTPRTVLIGLIGAGIQPSRSPALHMAEGAAHGLSYIYRLIDLDRGGLGAVRLPELIGMARHFGFAGLNITHPCKQTVIPLLDELSAEARSIGAVNTVGFAEGFRRELADAPRRLVVQLGAGGAGAAVGHALMTLGVERLIIYDTDRPRAERLADHLVARFGPGRAAATADPEHCLTAADGLVNATPVGMAGYPGTPVPTEALRPDRWVADIVYFPLETELLRQARGVGCRTMAGGTMAVFQAVDAFRLFTGLEPDPERMLRHFAGM